MMEDNEKNELNDLNDVYSNAVRAGKRTYFFDVRATRGNDYYLTLTESKRVYNEDGTYRYQKHKIFLYKEDFEKFSKALQDAFLKIIELNQEKSAELEESVKSQFTDISFEDLDNNSSNTESKSENE